MIWAKKRFTVLERDWFRCQYCGKNGKDVTLEVDHVIPKSKWWTDELTNLITCCRECNIGKWKDVIWDVKWIIRMKIKDKESEMLRDFFQFWNESWLWTMTSENVAYISWFIKSYFNWDMVVGYVEQCLVGKIGKSYPKWTFELKDFYEWGVNCDLAINEWGTFVWENDIWDLVVRVQDEDNDEEWLTEDYNKRLNYLLSRTITRLGKPMSLLFKYSLFPNMVETWQKEKEEW